jgi:hypothetical protein
MRTEVTLPSEIYPSQLFPIVSERFTDQLEAVLLRSTATEIILGLTTKGNDSPSVISRFLNSYLEEAVVAIYG